MRGTYEFGNWNGDTARLQVYLVHGHCFRAIINECVKQAQQSARNAGVLNVPNNVNDPDYEGKWSEYLTVDMVEHSIEAELEQRSVAAQAMGKTGGRSSLPVYFTPSGVQE